MYRAGSETTLMQPNVLVPWEKYKRQAVSELRDGEQILLASSVSNSARMKCFLVEILLLN